MQFRASNGLFQDCPRLSPICPCILLWGTPYNYPTYLLSTIYALGFRLEHDSSQNNTVPPLFYFSVYDNSCKTLEDPYLHCTEVYNTPSSGISKHHTMYRGLVSYHAGWWSGGTLPYHTMAPHTLNIVLIHATHYPAGRRLSIYAHPLSLARYHTSWNICG